MDWKKLLSTERIKKSNPHDVRNQFESDYGRIIYSPALRRMHDKTQVFPLTTDDNIHSRLTHSNEVMSLGYTLGIRLSKSKKIQDRTGLDELELIRILPVLLQNICLIHDIGNAPFGHFGETIVSDYFSKLEENKHPNFIGLTDRQKRDFFNYDGNAQGLRVLTKLQYLDNPFGLNLTYATLASYLKYPNYEEINKNVENKLKAEGKILEEEIIERSKHGVLFSEDEYFSMIVDECGLLVNGRVLRHPLCYLMEAADSIAYLCMDMEDGFNKGLFNISFIKKVFEKSTAEISKKVVLICETEDLNDTTKMVNLRIALISYLMDLAFENFENNLELIEEGKYNKELIKQDKDKIYKLIQAFSIDKIFSSRDINYLESTGYSVFKGLLDFYVNFLFNDNEKYRQRAKSLISKSIIDTAVDENLIELCQQKLQKRIDELEKDIDKFSDSVKFTRDLKSDLKTVKEKQKEYRALENEYFPLYVLQTSLELEPEQRKHLRNVKAKIYDLIEPEFDDLSDYFKFRIILDFISGMTDQFALNHYQKLSGQKIN